MLCRYYSTIIFSAVGISPLAATAVTGAVNVIATCATVTYVDRVGRVPLLLTGAIGMLVSSLLVACVSSLAPVDASNASSTSWSGLLTVLFVCTHVICFAYSWGPIGWYTTQRMHPTSACTYRTCLASRACPRVHSHRRALLVCLCCCLCHRRIVPAEIFPLGVRGKAVSLTTTVNWLGSFAVGEIVPSMLSATGVGGTFYVISACLCVCLLFVLLIGRETKGVTLERMEAVFDVNDRQQMERYMKENWARGLTVLKIRDEQPSSGGGR